MELDMHTRRKLSTSVAKRYRGAGKKEKGGILEEFVASTGYNRDYAAHLLSNWGKGPLPDIRERRAPFGCRQRTQAYSWQARRGKDPEPTMKRLSGRCEPSGNSWATPAGNCSAR